MSVSTVEALEPVQRLARDLKKSSVTMGIGEVRSLVDSYYLMQEGRKRAMNQARSLSESEEPHDVLRWLWQQFDVLEKQVRVELDAYSASDPLGVWARSVVGIGPVIAAGLLAHIDIERAKTAGAIWRYAGLDPTQEWKKGERRPWNAQLKTLCWKIGESFVKTSGLDGSFYGGLYAERKELETQRNEAGEFSDQAAAKLKKYKIGKTTDAYKCYSVGLLPPGHIHARAKRYAVKLFLAHYHEVAWKLHYGKEPPLPYPIAILGHAHAIPAPGEDL